SWGILVCLRPALRPRQDRLDRPYDEVGAAPAVTKTRTPTTKISGLNHTALALAVYASSRPLLHEDARLASRCWPLYGTGLVTRRIPTKGFELLLTSLPPFPGFPGAMSVHFSLDGSGPSARALDEL